MAGDDFPAWGGVVGDAMTSAATAYLKALREPTAEQDREAIARKARKDEADIALQKAHALYYGRPEKSTARPIKVGNKVVWVGPDGAEVLFEGEPDKPKTLETIRAETLRGMEERMGQKYGVPHLPISAWKSADFNEPFLDPLRDFVGIGRSPLVTTPGGPGAETRPKRDIGGYGKPSADTGTPAAAPPDAQTPPSAQPPPPKPAGQAPPSRPTTPGAKATSGTRSQEAQAATPDPYFLKHYESRLPHLPIEQADEQWALLTDPQANTKPENLAAFLTAYKKVHGKVPPGVEETGMTQPSAAATPPATPSAKPSSPPPAPGTPPKTPGRRELAPVAPPPPPPDWGRSRTTPLNNEQLAQVASDAYKLDLQYRQAQAQELEVERKNREEDTKNELRALGGDPTPEIKEVTLKLNATGRVQGKDFTRLTPDEQKLVIDTKNLPKLRKEEQSWKKLAQKSIDEVNALQTSQDLVTMILPLIKSDALGMAGKISQAGLWMRSLWGKNRFYQEAEANLKKTPEGRALLDKLGQAAVDARVASDIESNDPAVRESQRHIATRARLQTLSSVLMYAHALAQKRITGGSARGLIKPDMDEAHKLFDPDLFFAAPEQLMANLQELQGVIQGARARVEEDVRSYHFTPVIGVKGRLTWKYQPGEVDEEAPAAAPAVIAPTALERLQGAGTK